MNSLGARLRAARKAVRLRQAEVQERLGWGPTAVSDYETEKYGISDQRLFQLAQLYGVDASELAGRPVHVVKDDAFYDGILHSLAVFNRATGELLEEIRRWRAAKGEPTE